jgi:EmrB/QacA subfamily drug resistance transporter
MNTNKDSYSWRQALESTKSKAGAQAVFTVALGTFMCSFDINAINMALPLMQADFMASMAAIEWVVVAYLLALSATLLSFGRLADMFGHKRLYIMGFTGFTLSSLLCVLSPSLIALVVCVVLQGFAAALMMSCANAIVIASVAPSNRGKALGMTAIAVALATCAGPALGGLLAASFGWKAIYLVNVPIGAIGTILALRVIAKDGEPSSARFDLLGAALIAAALVSILLPLDLLSSSRVQSALVWVLVTAGVVLSLLFVRHERSSDHPILDLSLFKNRIFAASNLAATFFYLSMFIMVFLAPFYLQRLRGLSPTASGLMMLPMSISLMIAAPLGGALSDRFDSRYMSSAGLALVALGELCIGFFSATTPAALLIVGFAIIGVGMGLFQTPNSSAVMGSVATDRRGVAGATLATMRNVGMVLGEAVSAAILSSCMASRGEDLASGGAAVSSSWSGTFGFAMALACGAAAAAAIIALVLSLARGRVAPPKASGARFGY